MNLGTTYSLKECFVLNISSVATYSCQQILARFAPYSKSSVMRRLTHDAELGHDLIPGEEFGIGHRGCDDLTSDKMFPISIRYVTTYP